MKRISTPLLALCIFTIAAYGHNGMIHVMGTVSSTTAISITVKTTGGTTQSVALTSETKYLRGQSAITLKDITVGSNIVIHATKKGQKLIAAEVKIGAAKAASGEMQGKKMGNTAPK